jgi:hypothetical protein
MGIIHQENQVYYIFPALIRLISTIVSMCLEEIIMMTVKPNIPLASE